MNFTKQSDLVKQVYNRLWLGLLTTAITCYMLIGMIPVTGFSVITTGLLFLGVAVYAVSRPSLLSFGLYSIMAGVLLSFSLLYVTTTVITSALLITGIVFTGLTFYVNVSGKDFSSWGSKLLWLLVLLIIASVVNIFVGSEVGDTLISALGVLIFSGFILYDTDQINKGNFENKYAGALSMHLNLVNLFLHLTGLLDD